MLTSKEEKSGITESVFADTECHGIRKLLGKLCASLLGWIVLAKPLEQF
jgi:hypothetical protein